MSKKRFFVILTCLLLTLVFAIIPISANDTQPNLCEVEHDLTTERSDFLYDYYCYKNYEKCNSCSYTENIGVDHIFDNGFCTVCGGSEGYKAALNSVIANGKETTYGITVVNSSLNLPNQIFIGSDEKITFKGWVGATYGVESYILKIRYSDDSTNTIVIDNNTWKNNPLNITKLNNIRESKVVLKENYNINSCYNFEVDLSNYNDNYESLTLSAKLNNISTFDLFTLNVTNTCTHEEYIEGSCTVCGYTCAHIFIGEYCANCCLKCSHGNYIDGACELCGFCLTHTFNPSEGLCKDCGFVCWPHTSCTCTICGYESSHVYVEGYCVECNKKCPHNEFDNGTCKECGYKCNSHSYEDGICSICGFYCPHLYKNGFCTICNDPCNHEFHGGTKCVSCELVCAHDEYVNGACKNCGYGCVHVKYINGVCSACGYKCKHNFRDGNCQICYVKCDHDYVNSACTICGGSCTHVKYVNGKCTACGKICVHISYTDGVCEVCRLACTHTTYVNGICNICGLAEPVETEPEETEPAETESEESGSEESGSEESGSDECDHEFDLSYQKYQDETLSDTRCGLLFGSCVKCGVYTQYEAEHENTAYTEYTKLSNLCYYTYYCCENCEYLTLVDSSKEHNYIAGTCSICGFVGDQSEDFEDHTNHEFILVEIYPIGEENCCHVKEYICTLCGFERQESINEHTVDGDICTVCNYSSVSVDDAEDNSDFEFDLSVLKKIIPVISIVSLICAAAILLKKVNKRRR